MKKEAVRCKGEFNVKLNILKISVEIYAVSIFVTCEGLGTCCSYAINYLPYNVAP